MTHHEIMEHQFKPLGRPVSTNVQLLDEILASEKPVVIIEGDPGTGKGMLASQILRHSPAG